MKRIFDFFVALVALILISPILLPIIFLVWLQDRHSPFYVAERVGLNESIFNMVKLRSMIINADKSGIDSTSANDVRITKVGHFIRRYKLDELTQLWNVILGDMSLVGPRPNVIRETNLYTQEEKKLLSVRPGITDFASIIFSDEGEILKEHSDPDIAYNQLIRPGKSMLGIFYVEHRSLLLDIQLCFLTVFAILSKERSLKRINKILRKLNANQKLLEISLRKNALVPMPPPGAKKIVTDRSVN